MQNPITNNNLLVNSSHPFQNPVPHKHHTIAPTNRTSLFITYTSLPNPPLNVAITKTSTTSLSTFFAKLARPFSSLLCIEIDLKCQHLASSQSGQNTGIVMGVTTGRRSCVATQNRFPNKAKPTWNSSKRSAAIFDVVYLRDSHQR